MENTKIFQKNNIAIYIFCLLVFFLFRLNYSGAQVLHNVSGIWTTKFSGIEKGCQDISKNGFKEGTFTFKVTQNGDAISAIFDDDRTTNILIGKITGNLIKITVKGSTSEDCNVKTTLRGQIIGENKIKGSYEGGAINCETCKWEGKFTIDIKRW